MRINQRTTWVHNAGHTFAPDVEVMWMYQSDCMAKFMCRSGTLVDPNFQYHPEIAAGEKGGTLNPFTRKVLQKDIDDLQLEELAFDKNGFAVLGDFSAVWHQKHLP